MTVSRRVRHSTNTRRGRHAIRRAGSLAVASRLRHAQLVLSRGVYRTRTSAMREPRVRTMVRHARISLRGPFRLMERILAVRLAPTTG